MNFEEFKNKIISKDRRVKKLLEDDNFNFNFEVSHLVTEARLKMGMTQAQLAKAVGTKQPSIARLESGKELPTLPFLMKIAKAINTRLIPPRFEFLERENLNTQSINWESLSTGHQVNGAYVIGTNSPYETKEIKETINLN